MRHIEQTHHSQQLEFLLVEITTLGFEYLSSDRIQYDDYYLHFTPQHAP
jgi:hypothetical protein